MEDDVIQAKDASFIVDILLVALEGLMRCERGRDGCIPQEKRSKAWVQAHRAVAKAHSHKSYVATLWEHRLRMDMLPKGGE
mgnify:CR=1 FL=1|jgi:hypothetical protein